MENVLAALLGGSGFGALVAGIASYVQARAARKRKEKTEGDDRLDAVADGVKYLLYVEILRLGRKFIEDGSVDFDERKILNTMHSVYHNGLHGNGDLDNIMEAVNDLPLKK